MTEPKFTVVPTLTNELSFPGSDEVSEAAESVWLEVIHKMESVYADLVQHQTELETKNAELQLAYEQLKQTQQQLVHAEKMASLGRLVAGVAHELNNPISFVFGNMHALKRYGGRIAEYLQQVDKLAPSEELEALKSNLKIDRILSDMNPLIEGTLEGAERVSDIVRDLLRYSGGQKEPLEIVDLPSVIRKAVEWVMRASRVQPELEYQLPEHFELKTRNGQVHQILVNLIQNALDAIADQAAPKLVISHELKGQRFLIHVTDNGAGIPDHALPHIFEPFYSSKPVGQGTGLGLYISYGLAQELGGDLSAGNVYENKANTNFNQGARFTLALPLE